MTKFMPVNIVNRIIFINSKAMNQFFLIHYPIDQDKVSLSMSFQSVIL